MVVFFLAPFTPHTGGHSRPGTFTLANISGINFWSQSAAREPVWDHSPVWFVYNRLGSSHGVILALPQRWTDGEGVSTNQSSWLLMSVRWLMYMYIFVFTGIYPPWQDRGNLWTDLDTVNRADCSTDFSRSLWRYKDFCWWTKARSRKGSKLKWKTYETLMPNIKFNYLSTSWQW